MKFFHAVAAERRKRNHIKRLRREDGTVVEKEAMKEVVTNYFLNLFTSHAGTRMGELLSQVESRVTPQMNESLNLPFSKKEVIDALESIGDLKAPGPDGMPSIFYKKMLGHCRREGCGRSA